jgi:hypothetical protein
LPVGILPRQSLAPKEAGFPAYAGVPDLRGAAIVPDEQIIPDRSIGPVAPRIQVLTRKTMASEKGFIQPLRNAQFPDDPIRRWIPCKLWLAAASKFASLPPPRKGEHVS